jgi:voltage-gated potassium channel Kch
MKPTKMFDRWMARIQQEPINARRAAQMVAGATTLVVLGGGALMWLIDNDEYPNLGRALWWAMQTVTTVGYGDVTPANVSGRIVAAVVMLWGVAFVSILVASITSVFVARNSRLREAEAIQAAQIGGSQVDARFDDLAARMDRLEAAIASLAGRPASADGGESP